MNNVNLKKEHFSEWTALWLNKYYDRLYFFLLEKRIQSTVLDLTFNTMNFTNNCLNTRHISSNSHSCVSVLFYYYNTEKTNMVKSFLGIWKSAELVTFNLKCLIYEIRGSCAFIFQYWTWRVGMFAFNSLFCLLKCSVRCLEVE